MTKRLIGLCVICFLVLSACAHHVTVPKTTPDPAIGHEHSSLQRLVPCKRPYNGTGLLNGQIAGTL